MQNPAARGPVSPGASANVVGTLPLCPPAPETGGGLLGG